MSYILNIETATKNCSVALAKEGKIISFKEMANEGYSHAECLHVFIEDIMNEAGITFKDLSAIAVSQGPGSYTGLRIGVSAAKGLCYALNLPLIAIDTLKVLASQLTFLEGFIVPMLDARRMEVYSAIFDIKLNVIRSVQAEVIDENSFMDIQEKVYFVGDCADKCKPVMTSDNFIFEENVKYPSAKDMCILSFQNFLNQDFESLAYFEPYYLKDFMVTVSKK